MAIKYQDTFESYAVGAAVPGWVNVSGTWTATATNPVGGTKAFSDSTQVTHDIAVYTGTAAQADMAVQVDQIVHRASGFSFAVTDVLVRANAAGTTGYLTDHDIHSNQLNIYAIVSGTLTVIASVSMPVFNEGDRISTKTEVLGTTIRARTWVQGTTEPTTWMLSVTDTTISGAGYAGLRLNISPPTSSVATVDNFGMGDVGSAFAFIPGMAPSVTAVTPGATHTITLIGNAATAWVAGTLATLSSTATGVSAGSIVSQTTQNGATPQTITVVVNPGTTPQTLTFGNTTDNATTTVTVAFLVAPGLLAGTPMQTAAPLSWTAATSGTAPYSYQLQTSPDNGANAPTGVWTTNGSSTTGLSTVATGLTNTTRYWFRVVATDASSPIQTATSAPVSVTTPPPATMTASPTAIQTGSLSTITLTGVNTFWTNATTVALSAGGSASLVSQIVTVTAQTITVSIDPGQTPAGAVTLTTTDGLAVTIAIAVAPAPVGVTTLIECRDNANGGTRQAALVPVWTHLRRLVDNVPVAPQPAIFDVGNGQYKVTYDAETNGEAAGQIDFGATLALDGDRYQSLTLTRDSQRLQNGINAQGVVQASTASVLSALNTVQAPGFVPPPNSAMDRLWAGGALLLGPHSVVTAPTGGGVWVTYLQQDGVAVFAVVKSPRQLGVALQPGDAITVSRS